MVLHFWYILGNVPYILERNSILQRLGTVSYQCQVTVFDNVIQIYTFTAFMTGLPINLVLNHLLKWC